MRFLYLTDTHIRATTPKNRKDNFPETLKSKFMEVIQICEEQKVDFLLHGGDWFDRPDASPAIVSEFAAMIKSLQRTVYSVAGNHDLFGQNPDTLSRTMLGLLDATGVVRILRNGEEYFVESNGVVVQLMGSSFRYDIDREHYKKYYIAKKRNNVDCLINIIHGMLLERPFIEGIDYTLIKDIEDTEADITLSGHYHSGFGIKKRKNKYFINPGSLARVANTLSEIGRKPKVVLIEINNQVSVREILLKTALAGEKVLDREKIEDLQARMRKLDEFYKDIHDAKAFESIGIDSIIKEIVSNHRIDEQVKEEALRRISLAREQSDVPEDE